MLEKFRSHERLTHSFPVKWILQILAKKNLIESQVRYKISSILLTLPLFLVEHDVGYYGPPFFPVGSNFCASVYVHSCISGDVSQPSASLPSSTAFATSQDLSVSFHLSALMTTSRSHRAASTIHSTGRAEFLLLGTCRDPSGSYSSWQNYSLQQLFFYSTRIHIYVFCYKGPKILKGFHLFYFIPISIFFDQQYKEAQIRTRQYNNTNETPEQNGERND